MRDRPSVLALTPPRRSRMTLADQVEMLAALTQARRAAARGLALEIVGADGHVSFLARAATPVGRDQLAMVLSGYYPQGSIRVLDAKDDPVRLGVGEGALACELRLSRGHELPLRTIRDDASSSQLLRVIGVLRGLAPGTRALCQLILWPAPRRWSRALEAWLRQEREHRALRPAEAGGPPAGLVVGGGLALLAGVTGSHYYHAHDLLHLAGLAGTVVGCGALFVARATFLAPDPPPDPRLVERKLAAPACTARLRLLIAGGTLEDRGRGLDALVAAYGGFRTRTATASWPGPARPGTCERSPRPGPHASGGGRGRS
jgi:hypothetical protein